MNKKCQIFTPEAVVEDLLNSVNYKENLFGKKVIDTACGDGNMLVIIVRRYIEDAMDKGLEHFAPKEKFAHLEFIYDNLLYSCPYCNISKSNKWVSEDHQINVVGNIGFLDPCGDEYYKHLKRDIFGRIVYTSELGKYLYFEMKLYLRRHEILHNLEKIRIKRKQIELRIEEKKRLEEDYSKLESLYKDLCVTFCEYYDILVDEFD